MKKTILLSCLTLLSFSVFAQFDAESENKLRIRRAIWNSNDPDFTTYQCDDKWKNESAVILCRKYQYSVQKEILVNTAYEKIYNHTRILLLDKAAVEEFSTFKFDISQGLGSFGWRNDRSIYFGIKVVKPDRSSREVPIDESLIDAFGSRRSKKQTQKIAVPGLEPGDIIDFYYASEKTLSVQGFYPFSPVLYPLADDYPIMKQKIEMHIMRRCYLNARSMNGAPELTLQDDSKRSDMVYTITDENRDKIKTNDLKLFYPLREVPVLMFQANFVNNSFVKNNFCFYDREGVIKKEVSDFEIKEFLNNHFNMVNSKAIRKTARYIKKLRKTQSNQDTLAREAYYYYRQFSYVLNFKEDYAHGYYKNTPPEDYEFARSFSQILSRSEIPHSVVVTVPREIGKMGDLIMPNQIGFLICLHTSSSKYISAFSKFSLFNEVDNSYQGNDGKAMKMTALSETRNIENVVIPQMNYKENTTINKMNVSFDPLEADKLFISQSITAYGLNKKVYQSSVISPADYIKFSGPERYGIESNPSLNYNLQTRFDQADADFLKKREESLNDHVKEDFDISDVKATRINIVQPGIWEAAPALQFTDSLEIGKFITKAGDNIIFEAGKLIGKQITPEGNDTSRKFNIYLPYAGEYQYEISVTIPEGYQVKGTNSFNFNVTNATGGFISYATIEGNKVIFKTSKYFTSNYYSKDKWPEILKFLNASQDFKAQKVMFVPIK